MKVKITDTFTKSLKRLIWQEGIIYKSYSLFRYDIPRFIANMWRFRKVLWNHEWYDYTFTLKALHTCVSIMENKFRNNGYEIRETREKKVEKMQRALELMKNKLDDNYMERAEEVLGKLPHRDLEFEDSGDGTHTLIDNDTEEEKAQWRKVYDYANQLEESEWNELWNIFKGQKEPSYDEWIKIHSNEFTQEEIDDLTAWNIFQSGDDMRSWWD